MASSKPSIEKSIQIEGLLVAIKRRYEKNPCGVVLARDQNEVEEYRTSLNVVGKPRWGKLTITWEE